MKITNVFGMKFSGACRKDFVAVAGKHGNYLRAYAKPKNTNTEQQQRHREMFAAAASAWKGLTGRQREFYNRIADRETGYNLFVSRHIKAARNGTEPELPIAIAWTVLRPDTPDDGWLKVSNSSGMIFNDDLRERNGEFALTPSDGRYKIVLISRQQKDIELTVEQLLDLPVPTFLENETLSVKLFLPPPARATATGARTQGRSP